MKNYMNSILFILIFFISGCAHNEFQIIESHRDIKLDLISKGTLVVFDVDETLIQPIDSYLVNEHSPKGKAFLRAFVSSHPKFPNWDILTSATLKQAKRPLIEKGISNIFKKMRISGAQVIVLTAMNTGPLGDIEYLEKWRYNHLKSLGVEGDFNNRIISLKGFKGNPVFYKGMAAADIEDKGLVLENLLERLGYQPRSIVAIDDDVFALKSIQKTCRDLGIPFQGYQYMGYKTVPWDGRLIFFQAEYLLKNKKWLRDAEARSKMLKRDNLNSG